MPDRFNRMSAGEIDSLRGQIGYQPERFARMSNNMVASARLSTNSSGEVSFTFPTPFDGTPVVQVLPECASGYPYFPQITALSASAVTVRLYRARVLPTLATVAGTLGEVTDGVNDIVSALTAYDAFSAAVGAGVVVHIYAMRAS